MRRWPVTGLVVPVVAVLVLGGLSVLVAVGAPSVAAAEAPVERAVRSLRSPDLTAAAAVLTTLGSLWVLAPLTVVVAVVGRRTAASWRPGAAVALAVAGAYASTELMKRGLERPRPDDRLVEAAGWSFPSGHATDSAAWWLTAAALAVGTLAGRSRREGRLLGWSAGVLVTLVVGATRVYLGVHHPADVLGGWALGVIWAWVALQVMIRPGTAPGRSDVSGDVSPG